MSQSEQKSKKRKNNARAMRNQKMMAEAAAGKTTNQIAAEFGVSRQAVNRVMSSEDAKQVVKNGNLKLTSLVDKALLVAEKVLDGHDLALAFQASVRVLKSVGIMRDKVDIAHSYPKPTVIKLMDGSEVVLGLEKEGGE